jgi:hypothetical protein
MGPLPRLAEIWRSARSQTLPNFLFPRLENQERLGPRLSGPCLAMPPQPVPAPMSVRQAWGSTPLPRRPLLCPQCALHRRTLSSWRRRLETLRTNRAQETQQSEPNWRNTPAFLRNEKPPLTDYQVNQLKGELKRWEGRRSIYLGGYSKVRRDAGYVAHETERPLSPEEKKNPLLALFQGRERDLSLVNGCAPVQTHAQRQMGVGIKFGMDADYDKVCVLFLPC